MNGPEDTNRSVMSCFYDGSPVPDLLTEQEAIRFLRLDTDGPTNPKSTLKYYREKKLLRATRVGAKYRYCKKELLDFLRKVTEWTNLNRQ